MRLLMWFFTFVALVALGGVCFHEDGRRYWVSQMALPRGPVGSLVVAPFMEAQWADHLKWVLDQTSLQPGHSVLEIGFGSGAVLEHVANVTKLPPHLAGKHSNVVVGMELSPDMVRLATARNQAAVDDGHVVLLNVDATVTPLPFTTPDVTYMSQLDVYLERVKRATLKEGEEAASASVHGARSKTAQEVRLEASKTRFDVILHNMLLPFLEDPVEFHENLRKLLKPSGVVLSCMPLDDDFRSTYYYRFLPNKLVTKRDHKEIFEDAGYDKVQVLVDPTGEHPLLCILATLND